MNKKVALIGASGFVGSAILNELLNRGYQVKKSRYRVLNSQ